MRRFVCAVIIVLSGCGANYRVYLQNDTGHDLRVRLLENGPEWEADLAAGGALEYSASNAPRANQRTVEVRAGEGVLPLTIPVPNAATVRGRILRDGPLLAFDRTPPKVAPAP
jgi:hypothetical protein